jgi:fumarylpyruvate hydrolase
MNLGMDPQQWPRLTILGTEDTFLPRRVWCVGRNYAAHAREMGEDGRKPPLIFSKNPICLTPVAAEVSGRVNYPPDTEALHHEVEMVLALGEGGKVLGAAVGLDMTRRDLQTRMKERRGPWSLAKDFDGAAPIGPIRLGPVPENGEIGLWVDGERRQVANLNEMIWDAEALCKRLSETVQLAAGDLIFTGTPAGVGPVVRGQTLRAEIEGLPTLQVVVD